MSHPIFNIGDKIDFEIAKSTMDTSATPRWAKNGYDFGASGIYAIGKVVKVSPEYIEVEYSAPGYIGNGHCLFPYYQNKFYKPDQWSRTGYLRKIAECDCGAKKTYGQNTNIHANWCSMKTV